ncbi:DUF6089 family protein [Porphyromonas circumdentaria]|uniref:DUF6089 domain-containing protein n=1 Tax=Porphyromonas circumdentaria TaxID=29524 RepID=A0A1T4KZT2_9PORP|nr:DUF6089 family protein [Porphyromonas circumdentaria]MBB6275153.1 hypothetical protein [Porphyromonas circumdentaria]SJZ47873.1 hypothetical protein SAMN02745171_00236 [Porphyromonas circumdentaria]
MTALFRYSSILLITVLGYSAQMAAQEYRYEVGVSTGTASYLGDANPYNPIKSIGGSLSGTFRYNHNFRFAFSGHLDYFYLRGNTKGFKDNHFPNGAQASFALHGTGVAVRSEYNFYPYSDKFPFLQTRRFTPYIAAGAMLGVSMQQASIHLHPGVNLGLGIKYKLKNRLNLIAFLEGTHFFSDRLDTSSPSSKFLSNPYNVNSSLLKGGDGMVRFMVGISYEFQKQATKCNNDK